MKTRPVVHWHHQICECLIIEQDTPSVKLSVLTTLVIALLRWVFSETNWIVIVDIVAQKVVVFIIALLIEFHVIIWSPGMSIQNEMSSIDSHFQAGCIFPILINGMVSILSLWFLDIKAVKYISRNVIFMCFPYFWSWENTSRSCPVRALGGRSPISLYGSLAQFPRFCWRVPSVWKVYFTITGAARVVASSIIVHRW